MNRLRLLMLMALAVPVGCYRVTVITGAPPAPQKIERTWQNSVVFNIVTPAEIDTKEVCPLGISKFQMERSFPNSLVGLITYPIYTPFHVTVTCASGPVVR